MSRLLYILFLALVGCIVLSTSCKTTKVVTYRDTVTVVQLSTEYKELHDTTVIHDSTEVEITRVQFDTLERIKEVQKIVYKNGRQEQGSHIVKEMVHDTLYVSAGSTQTAKTTTPKPSAMPILMLAMVLSLLIVYIWRRIC